MKHDIIVCLVGKSGVGKTSVAHSLRHKYNIIQSYTTRPKRDTHEWGHTFVVPDYAIPHHNAISYTFYNGYRYWATREQYQNKGVSIYVVDPVGVKFLKERVKDAKIIVIYLECNFFTRLSRLLQRDGIIKGTKRIINDQKEFRAFNYDYSINAKGTLNDVAKEVRGTINHALNWRGIY